MAGGQWPVTCPFSLLCQLSSRLAKGRGSLGYATCSRGQQRKRPRLERGAVAGAELCACHGGVIPEMPSDPVINPVLTQM